MNMDRGAVAKDDQAVPLASCSTATDDYGARIQIEEIPAKCKPTDFTMCIICQESNKKYKLSKPRELSSYETFLESMNKRSEFGNPDFLSISRRLVGVTAADLLSKGAQWHRNCYSDATNKSHIERDETKYRPSTLEHTRTKSAGRLSTSAAVRLTRSVCPMFDRTECFFCQGKDPSKADETIHACQSENVAKAIQDIIHNSDNDSWKVRLADIIAEGDFLARDIVYHSSCKLAHWRKYVQGPQRSSTGNERQYAALLSAELEFYDELLERIESGEYVTTVDAETLYRNMLCDHGVDYKSITRRTVVKKISDNVPNIVLSPNKGNLPGLFHSKKAGREALDTANIARDIKGDLNAIFKCAKIIRGVISNSRKDKPWSFTGSLDSSSQGDVPLELMMMNRWILQGSKAATTESRDHVLRKSCTVISQTMIQEFKSTRQMTHNPKSESAASLFRRQLESPFAVGLSLWMYHNLRSQKAITVLSNMCTGITYSRVTHVCSQIANAVLENINLNGVFVPYGLVKGRAIRASADNVDKKVDTYDGKNSFHAMASSVYQPTCDGETLVEALDLYKVSPGALVDVPVTCIKLIPCDITGSPKPRTSPCYRSYRVGFHEAHYEQSLKNDIAWMMARYLNRSSQCTLSVSYEQTDLPDVGLSGMTTISADTIAINDADQLPDLACDKISDIGLDAQTTVLDNAASSMTETEMDQRDGQPASSTETTQRIPVWSAYNSISTQQTSLTIDKSYSLPIINAPAHEWPTLVTTLDQLCRLNELVSGGRDKLVVTFDMDLYKRVLKLEHLDARYKDKLMVCPGAFHASLCALRCLGRTIEGSGIDDTWVEADMYSSVTVNQIINGNHYSRAVEAHEITLQVFFDLWLEAFFTEKPAVRTALEDSVQQLSTACESKQGVHDAHMALLVTMESLNLHKQLADFDARHGGHPMFQWARMYMRQVMTLLQFHRSTREGDWFLHLSSLEKLCVYFFAYDRLDYAQNTPEYVARMYQLQTVDPEIWNRFLSGEFTVNSSNTIPFTRLGVDQAQEQANKTLKGQGAINGITQTPATLLKFCMCAPELARIANETENMIGMINQDRTVHHRLNPPTVRRQEQAIANLSRVLKPCNIFTSDETHMFKLMTKEILPKEIEESILATERRGSTAMNAFIEERICGDTNLWDKMTKCKPLLWNSSSKEVKLQAKSEVLTLRATTGLMSRLLIIARSSREIDMEEVIGNYEFSTSNRTLMTLTGGVHPTLDKSKVIAVLENMPDERDDENMVSAVVELSPTTNKCLIVDGMAVVQELMAVSSFETCRDFGNAYVELINAKARNYEVTRVVFDNYSITGSLKETTRERRRGGKKPPVGYQVNDSTKIKEKKTFLSSNTTKDSLTLYLAQKLIDNAQVDIITATHKDVMSNRSGSITPGVSSQEEADTLMIFHAVEAAKTGYVIHIYSQDTDVLLAALRRVPWLGANAAMIMGTSDKRRLVMLQPIFNALGENIARALCKWHALTGCDTTGHIRGKSKIACLNAFLKADPCIVAAISALGVGSEPSDETIKGCISFLCSLFCKKGVTITQPHILRWSLFKQQGIDKGVEMLPPTYGAWIQHIRRAHCQSAIWEQDLIAHPIVPDPLMLGWLLEDNRLVPKLSDIAPAPTSIVELVKCRCGSSKPNAPNAICTSARCSCLAHGLVCTELCWCEGEDKCQNSSPSGN